MKGVILDCMEKLVVEKKGKPVWEKILVNSGFDKNKKFLITQDIDDKIVLKIIDSTCIVLNNSLQTTANAFGVYWMKYYAPKIYRAYFGNTKTAKDFLLKLNKTHEQVTNNIENARPPIFEYEQPDEKTLIMTYISERNLMEFFIGLIKGVGKYFDEELTIERTGGNKVKINFS